MSPSVGNGNDTYYYPFRSRLAKDICLTLRFSECFFAEVDLGIACCLQTRELVFMIFSYSMSFGGMLLGGASGLLPHRCDGLGKLNVELENLNWVYQDFLIQSTQKLHDVMTVQVRIDASESAIVQLGNGRAASNTNSLQVAA